jgi:S1-C subfamily serine protease
MSVFGMRAAVIGLLLSAFIGRSADFTPEDFKPTQLEAEKGDPEAQVALGRMCYLGQGTPQNYGEALKWYRRAAEKGNATAQNNLALMYLNGHGVPRNPGESAKWMQLAARNGLPKAQLNLGTFYLEGIGLGRNPPEAMNWFRRAANQGDSEGQRMLGQIHLEGQLARADLVEAYKWFSLAAAQGDSESREARDVVAKNLTDKQLADGQRRATAFVPRPEPGGLVEPKVTGTGFFVGNDGYFVTCRHVVEPAARIVIKTKGLRFAAVLVKTDKTNDLALLKVTGALPPQAGTNNPFAATNSSVRTLKAAGTPDSSRTNLLKVANKFRSLAVTNSDSIKLGDAVFAIGFPNIGVQGQEPKLTRGEINSLTGMKDNPRYFQISAPVQPGNSGGPLLDHSGNVVGVVAMSLNDLTLLKNTGAIPQNVNYAVKSAQLMKFLGSVPELKNQLKSPNALTGSQSATEWVSEVQESVALVQVY